LAPALRVIDDIAALYKIKGSYAKPNTITNDHLLIDPSHEPNHSE
jgi:alpha-D-ribose 1-methylphosphonate 5-phosphate C-P lyase